MIFLVTGGAGFIGSHCVKALLDRGERVVVLDDLNDFYDPAIKDRNLAPFLGNANFRFCKGDIRDRDCIERLCATERPEAIVHLAARAGVRASFEEPELYRDVNVSGARTVLEVGRTAGVRHFVLASSSSVYGERSDGRSFHEDDVFLKPQSPYAASKQDMERCAADFQKESGCTVTCLRFFTVYGPAQRPDMAIYRFIRAIGNGEPIEFYGDGSTRRDYTYVDDIVAGVLAALDRPRGFQIYNLGASRPVVLRDLVTAIEQVVGRKAAVRHAPPQEGDVSATFADISRAREELGYAPKTALREGIEKTVAWFREEKLLAPSA